MEQTVGATAFGPSISATQFNSLYEYRPRLNYTWLARPNLVYTLALGFTYVGSSTNNGSQPSAKYGATAGLKGVFTPNTPVVNIDNTSGFGTDYYTYVNPQFTVPVISSSLTWIRGAHTVKFGGDYVQAVIGSSVNFDTAGVFSFTNRMTGLSNLPATGWGYASFLLGQVDNASLSTSSDLRFAGRGWALYAQDQWRVTQKLTLNYGFRWNAGQTPREEHDRFGAFSLSTPNPAAGGRLGALSFWGTGPGLNGLRYVVNPNYAMFDPRLGLAYAFDKNTVIRAYYGIVSKQVFADFNEGTTAPTYGTSATVTSSTLDNGLTPAFNWNNGFPLTPTVPNLDPSFLNGSSVQEIDPSNNKGDRVQSFGLNVERSLPWGLTARRNTLGRWLTVLSVAAALSFHR